MKLISSIQNPLIKRLLQLQEKSRDRKNENVFVIDGWKETQMAIANGFEIETILFRKGFGLNFDELDAEQVIEISEEVFDRISYRGNTSKVVSIARRKETALNEIILSETPLILVLDGIEKPGNIGAILRTADAARIDAVICCNTQTDLYNPNIIRSSVGCLFTVPSIVCSKEDCLEYLDKNKLLIYTSSLNATVDYLHADYTKPAALILGSEDTGVDKFWEQHSDANIIIPMRGQNDSLNVSVTAAIILFEALRQRN